MSRKKKVRIESTVKHRPKILIKDIGVEMNSSQGDYSSTTGEDIGPEDEPVYDASLTPYQINATTTKRKAKELYICYGWDKQKLLTLGIPEPTLNTWLYQPTENTLGWKDERDNHNESILKSLKDDKADLLKGVQSRAVSIVKRGLLALDMEGDELSPRALKDIMGIVKEVNLLVQLEEGKPTSITADFEYTEKNIKKLIDDLNELDPLVDYEAKDRIN